MVDTAGLGKSSHCVEATLVSQSINPIAAEAARRALSTSQAEGADEQTASVARSARDQQELQELESAQLYRGAPPVPVPPAGRIRRWLRLGR